MSVGDREKIEIMSLKSLSISLVVDLSVSMLVFFVRQGQCNWVLMSSCLFVHSPITTVITKNKIITLTSAFIFFSLEEREACLMTLLIDKKNKRLVKCDEINFSSIEKKGSISSFQLLFSVKMENIQTEVERNRLTQ